MCGGPTKENFVYSGELSDVHPGFRDGSSVVLHRFASTTEENDLLNVGAAGERMRGT